MGLFDAERRFELEAYIEENFRHLRQSDRVLQIDCPDTSCDDNWKCGKHCYVYLESNSCYCFKCGQSFSVLKLLELAEGLTYNQAVKRLLSLAPKRVYPAAGKLREIVEERSKRKIPEKPASPPGVELPFNVPIEPGSPAALYLEKRGFGRETIEAFDLRFCPPGSPFMNRILIPVYFEGVCVGYQGRDITGASKMKYMFPKGAGFANYLYALDDALFWMRYRLLDYVVLCEGVTDVWRTFLSEERSVVGTFGKILKAGQRRALLETPDIKKVVIFWDGNAKADAYRLAEDLSAFKLVRVVELPLELEPDLCRAEDIPGIIDGAIEFEKLSPIDIARKKLQFEREKRK